MIVRTTPANYLLAQRKVEQGYVVTIAKNSQYYFCEYVSKDKNSVELITFQRKEDKLFAWHVCKAGDASNYAKGCWHLALIVDLLDDLSGEDSHEIEVSDIMCKAPATVDLTPKYVGKPGKFHHIPLLQSETLSSQETADLPEEDRFLVEKYYLPRRLILERLLPFRNRQKERLTDEQKRRIPRNVNYIPQGNEVISACAALLYEVWAPPLLMGPAGSGKSSLAELMAEILYLPLRKISGGIDVNAEYLLGSKTLEPAEEIDSVLAAKISLAATKAGTPLTTEEFTEIGEKLKTNNMQIVHEPGVLLQAVTDGEMVLVDEVNMLIPEVTSLLHALLDWQKTITVPGVGEVKAHEDFRLIAAMNVGYMGTRPLNKAFRDRFRGIQLPGIADSTLMDLLSPVVDDTTAAQLTQIYTMLYNNVYSPAGATLTESCLSLRALLRAAEEYSMGVGSLKEITISCLTESIESEQERDQVKDLIEMNLS